MGQRESPSGGEIRASEKICREENPQMGLDAVYYGGIFRGNKTDTCTSTFEILA